MNAALHGPRIDAISDGSEPRPFWSVMIPVYNASPRYLEETLRSILQQDPGPEEMQIEVVDDCSPNGPPLELVRQIAGNRVTVHREPKNNGLAGIWNRCIERARGRWVHILHQDDTVQNGFYMTVRRGTDKPEVGSVVVRYAVISPTGHWLLLPQLLQESAGILENWSERIFERQYLECAAVVVRREVYERLGGFRSELVYTLDWEMWQRVAAHYAVWYDPAILACYRTHPDSTTSRLSLAAADTRDQRIMIGIVKNYYPQDRAAWMLKRANDNCIRGGFNRAKHFLTNGRTTPALRQMREALKVSWSWATLCGLASFFLFWGLLAVGRIGRRGFKVGSTT